MSEQEHSDTRDQATNIELRSYFVRERNALAVRGTFSELYVDYYIHLMEIGYQPSPEHDQLMKDALAVLGLHLAARPWNEAAAWTLSWQEPSLNLFVTGSNRDSRLTCRIFTEDIRERDRNILFAQTTADGSSSRQSVVEVDHLNFFQIGEDYYLNSEQRPARFFRHDDEDFVMVAAQPDCDMEWFRSLDDDAIRALDQTETLSLLEKRNWRFECGCSMDRIFPMIGSMGEGAMDEVFGDKEIIELSCPRCGMRYNLTRETLEAWQADQQADGNSK